MSSNDQTPKKEQTLEEIVNQIILDTFAHFTEHAIASMRRADKHFHRDEEQGKEKEKKDE